MDLRCNSLELGVCTVQAIFAGKFHEWVLDRKSTRLNSSQITISYAVFCLKKKKKNVIPLSTRPKNTKIQRAPPNTPTQHCQAPTPIPSQSNNLSTAETRHKSQLQYRLRLT